MRKTIVLTGLGLMPFGLSGCSATDPAPAASPVATASVQARGETQAVGTANADAADDPAIWRNAANPAASLIVATDKKAGLYVYGLDGKVRSFVAAGRVNNVDLIDMGPAGGSIGVAGGAAPAIAAADTRAAAASARRPAG